MTAIALTRNLTYSRAASLEEFEQVFRLNHATFTGEIPQHAAHADGRLIDRFHAQNDYLLCKQGSEVVGMLALRAQRPFSLDQKLAGLDRYLPPARRVCEVRLLAVKPVWRHSAVFVGLVRALARRCAERNLDYAIISATTRQLKLYRHMGFKPFGPLNGSGDAQFQPMALALEDFNAQVVWLAVDTAGHAPPALATVPARPALTLNPSSQTAAPVLLTPGPVQMHPLVQAALVTPPQPHRSEPVMATLARCTAALCALTRAHCAQLLLGSGTLANDAIAQQLCARGAGLVLVNGEFGERLADHAARAGLDVQVHRVAWGKPFAFERIAATLPTRPAWIWMAHGETSTGMRNDADACHTLAQQLGADVVLDCISTIGNLPLDLEHVLFASGVSSKGVGAAAGLSFVLHRRDALRAVAGVPRSLDLPFAAQRSGMPFTQSSSLLAALEAALALLTPAHYAHVKSISGEVHAAVHAAMHAACANTGAVIIAPARHAAPGVITLALPVSLSSQATGRALLQQGFRIAFDSAYLSERNWVQIAWMGDTRAQAVLGAVAALSATLQQGAAAKRIAR